MWEELYRNFQEINQLQIDEDFYLNLAQLIDASNHKTDIEDCAIDFGLIEQALGGQSKCVLLPYGLDQEEQILIFNRIEAALDEVLDSDTEIILDITHSFRCVLVASGLLWLAMLLCCNRPQIKCHQFSTIKRFSTLWKPVSMP